MSGKASGKTSKEGTSLKARSPSPSKKKVTLAVEGAEPASTGGDGGDDEPSKQDVRDDVHGLLLFQQLRATALTDGFSVLRLASSSSYKPDLRRFTPQSATEVEYQCFNTSMLPPNRLLNAEAVANWLINPAIGQLNRRSVALFLSQASIISTATLETLATKVCRDNDKVVSSGSYIEALRAFAPITGCINLALEARASVGDEQLVLLRALAAAFLRNSKTSATLLGGGGSATTPQAATAAEQLLVRVGAVTLSSACALLALSHGSSQTPLAELRDAYHNALTSAYEEVPASPVAAADRAVMTAAFEAELFSGRLLAPLGFAGVGSGSSSSGGSSSNGGGSSSGSFSSSYIFAQPVLASWAWLRASPGQEAEHVFLVLTRDALYCFDEDVTVAAGPAGAGSNRFPRTTIPLAQCNAHVESDALPTAASPSFTNTAAATHSAPCRVELTSTAGGPVVVLCNAAVEGQQGGEGAVECPWWGVTSVVDRPRVLLEISGREHEPAQCWAAALEEAAWASREKR